MAAMSAATLRRVSASGPWTSATTVCSTGGPGGISTTAMRAPNDFAIGVSRWRASTAIWWLVRSRSSLSLIMTSRSPSQVRWRR
jgi:hypothetical protein